MPNGPRRGISIVTTCNLRLPFLKQALPSLDTRLPFTVVDFDCLDRTGAYLAAHYHTIRVVAVDNQPNFHPAMARNIGARNSAGGMILFLDRDVVLSQCLARFLCETKLSERAFFTCRLAIQDLTGACLAEAGVRPLRGVRRDLRRLGLRGCGSLPPFRSARPPPAFFPPGMIVAIPLSDALRLALMGQGNKLGRPAAQRDLLGIKLSLEGALRRPLNPSERQEVRNTLREAVNRAKSTSRVAQFSISLKTVRVATPSIAADAAFLRTRAFHFAVTVG
jgi:hypothetical protein